jgi:hypothetical protein
VDFLERGCFGRGSLGLEVVLGEAGSWDCECDCGEKWLSAGEEGLVESTDSEESQSRESRCAIEIRFWCASVS